VSNSIGGPITLTDFGGATNSQRFYRVDVFGCSTHLYADPVGFITVNAVGTNGVYYPTYSEWGLGMTQIPVLRGSTTSIAGQQVTVDGELIAGQYNQNTSSGATNPAYFIEFTSGANAGLMDDIVSNNATSIYTAHDNSSSITRSTCKVYPHWTIGKLFGPQNQAGLQGGSTGGAADNIQVWDPNTQGYASYFFKTGGLGGTGWRSASSALINASNSVLYIDRGVTIVRRISGDIPIKLVGAVKLGKTITAIVTNGYTFVGNVYPAEITYGESGLYTTNSATGLLGGVTTGQADNIDIWNPSTQGYIIYYFKTGGLGGTGWRSASNVTIDASTNTIPLGAYALIVRRPGNPTFKWVMPQPFTQ
jgi:hypothetical protein